MIVQDDLLAPDVVADPYTYFAWLREHDPVHWNERWGGWLVTRYDDVVRAFRDPERLSSDRMAHFVRELSEYDRERLHVLIQYFSKWLVFTDPPYHTRVRMLVNKAFTPTSVERLRPRTRQIVHELLDAVEGRGQMEFIRDFAFHLPVIVISEYMGVPPEDREAVKEWSDETSRIFFIRADDPHRRDRSQRGLIHLLEYFQPLIHDRRRNPRDDLISALVQAEERGDLLSEEELLATCTVLLFAGHETTTNLLANGLLALLRNRDQWELLRRDASLSRSATEELLRYDGPVKATFRWAKVDVEMGGKTMRSGDRMLLVLASANRDPARYPDPDRVDITRSPNPHVAFGHGIHVCLGAPLARVEGQEAFAALAERFPRMRLASEDLEYHPTLVSRALSALHVEW
ncbi:MAG: cytochrome P450 [Armatimonadota bacterium]|nr:cytochrome P450 [Armatimonadota bacterium]MDR5697473.1 cytochrome P450 [Armatimonadota bacterium]